MEQLLKIYENKKSISQESLAEQSSVSRATLSKLENGYIANISIVTINQILSLLGYEIDIKSTNPFEHK